MQAGGPRQKWPSQGGESRAPLGRREQGRLEAAFYTQHCVSSGPLPHQDQLSHWPTQSSPVSPDSSSRTRSKHALVLAGTIPSLT